MNDKEFAQLLERPWLGQLSASEKAELDQYLETKPEARALWEKEMALTHLLREMPDVPLANNFTSVVLRRLEQEQAPLRASRLGFRLAWPKWSVAAALVCAGLLAFQQFRTQQREEMARALAAVSQVTALPPEWLQDFDAINRLDHPPVDDELLAALQ